MLCCLYFVRNLFGVYSPVTNYKLCSKLYQKPKMNVLGKVIIKLFKPVAVLKYLFVPWVVVQSHGTQQFKATGTHKFTVQAKAGSKVFKNTLNTLAKP